MDVFKKLAIKNKEIKASICFLVKLSEIPEDSDGSSIAPPSPPPSTGLSSTAANTEKNTRFNLTLLKNGDTILKGFKAPPKIQTQLDKVKITSRKTKEVNLLVEYELQTLAMKEASYKLRATYNQIDESVS